MSDDVDVTTFKETLICLKLLRTNLLIFFTTKHVILAKSVHEAINTLEHRKAVFVTNIVTGWTLHLNMLVCKVA